MSGKGKLRENAHMPSWWREGGRAASGSSSSLSSSASAAGNSCSREELDLALLVGSDRYGLSSQAWSKMLADDTLPFAKATAPAREKAKKGAEEAAAAGTAGAAVDEGSAEAGAGAGAGAGALDAKISQATFAVSETSPSAVAVAAAASLTPSLDPSPKVILERVKFLVREVTKSCRFYWQTASSSSSSLSLSAAAASHFTAGSSTGGGSGSGPLTLRTPQQERHRAVAWQLLHDMPELRSHEVGEVMCDVVWWW
jgi:hypothetical protein